MQGLGGKFGEKICENLDVQYMAELLPFTKDELQKHCDERNSKWLYNLARGIDLEAVTPRLVPKSISCSKMFPRQNAITDVETLNHWLHELAKDVVERVDEDESENNRRPKQIVISFTQSVNSSDVSSSRAVNFVTNNEEKIVNGAIEMIKKNTTKFLKPDDPNNLSNPIKFLGFNVCKFESLDSKSGNTIEDLFRRSFQQKQNQSIAETSNGSLVDDSVVNGESSNSLLSKYHVEFNEYKDDSTDDEDNDDEIDQNLQPKIFESTAGSTALNNQEDAYVDYHSVLTQELPTVECSQCGKMVVEMEMQVHSDAHLAFQLNEEQRTEFQNQLKRTHVSKTPIKKKQKSESKVVSSKKTEATSIQKFLVRRRETTPEPSTSTASAVDVDVEKCAECGKIIPIADLFEHLDFHAAKKLQAEFMKSDSTANRINNSSIQKSKNNNNDNNLSSSKNKNGNKNKNKNLKNRAVRNITTFFQNTE